MKKILTTKEMVEHTTISKRVVHNDVEYSEKFLLMNNYQNVISAHKHNFHSGKDDNQKHIYSSDIEFARYVEEFNNERKDYPIIREKACMFEFYFKNLVNYYFLEEYKKHCIKYKMHCDELNIITFLDSRKNYCHAKKLKVQHSKTMDIITNKLVYDNQNNVSPFVTLNKLHLSEIRFLFVSLNKQNRGKIVRELVNNNFLSIPGNKNDRLKNFEYSLGRLIGIRNVVVHNNSLWIYKKVDQENYTRTHQLQKNEDVEKALEMYIKKRSYQIGRSHKALKCDT